MDLSEIEVVEKLVRGHFQREDKRWRRRRWFRAAHDDRFWDETVGNLWSELLGRTPNQDSLPIKVQVNLVKPFVQRRRSVLFYRNPRCEVVLPAVMSARSRRRIPLQKLEAVRATVDDLLRRGVVQDAVLHAMGMALMYEGAAFKVTYNAERRKGSPVDRIDIEAIPCWECMWDERAKRLEDQRYRAHIRYMPVERAAAIFGDMMPTDKDVPLRALPDVVRYGWDERQLQDAEERDTSYVNVLEFYDLVAKRLRWYIVGDQAGPSSAFLTKGPDLPIPYEWADGTPAAPLVPIILEHVPEHPLEALAPVAGVYEIGAERSLLLTVVANAMRRDAARVVLYLKEKGLTDDIINRIVTAFDMELVGVDAETLANLFAAFPVPELPNSLDKYQAWLDIARQDQTVQSDLAEGRQGKYLSATEAQVLAAGDEQAATEPQARLSMALSRASELAVRIIASEKTGGGLKVRVQQEVVTLKREDLNEAWAISVEDAASTPMRQAQKIAQFTGVQDKLIELVQLASEQPPPAPGAQPIPPIPAAVKAMAVAQLEYLTALLELPETMRPAAIFAVAEKEPEEDMAEPFMEPAAPTAPAAQAMGAAVPAPAAEVPAPPPPEQVQAMLDQMTPEQLQELQAMISGGGVQ